MHIELPDKNLSYQWKAKKTKLLDKGDHKIES